MKETKAKQWSARSQRSYLEEHRLRQELANCESGIAASERKVEELEKLKAAQLNRTFAESPGYSIAHLPSTVAALEDEKRCLSAFQEHRASHLSQIHDHVEVTPTEEEARTAQQERVAAMVAERLERDRKIDSAVAALKTMLQERAKLSARMAEACSAIELDFNDYVSERFDSLLASLPDGLAEASEAWKARQFGERVRAKPYIVRDDCLVVPETLAHSGVYRFGETILLTDAEAGELLRVDRPDPAANAFAPWLRLPPSISTIEAHEAATAKAEKKGISAKQVYFWEDYERDRELRERHQQNRGQDAQPPPASPSFRSLRPGRGDLVRVRAKGNIKAGRDYGPGETLEVNADDAWSLLRSGAAEPAD